MPSAEESCKWTGGGGPWLFGGESNFVGSTARFDGHLEGHGDSVRIAGDGNRGVDEDGIGAHLHGFRGMARRAESSIDDDGHGGLLDNDADLVTRLDAAIGAYGR